MPSLIRVTVLRSLELRLPANKTRSWVQVFEAGTSPQDFQPGAQHVVALELQVLSTVFRRIVQPILSFASQSAIVLSLIMSIMGVFRIVKKYLQVVVDKVVERMARENKIGMPVDLIRRESILSEKALRGARSAHGLRTVKRTGAGASTQETHQSNPIYGIELGCKHPPHLTSEGADMHTSLRSRMETIETRHAKQQAQLRSRLEQLQTRLLKHESEMEGLRRAILSCS